MKISNSRIQLNIMKSVNFRYINWQLTQFLVRLFICLNGFSVKFSENTKPDDR